MKNQVIIPSLQQIVNFFREETIDEIAKETGFSVRKRHLSAIVFLGIFTFGLIQKVDATLVQLVSLAKRHNPSLRLTPQGLHKRIHHKAVAFLMKMFAKSLTLTIDSTDNFLPWLEGFVHVNLLDTSQISLPQEVAHLFAAAGGSGSKAGAKIQLVIDYKTGHFSHLNLTDALASDQKLIPTIHHFLQASELWIFDLGCVSQEKLKIVADNGAFFLCRIWTQTALYQKTEEGQYQRLDLAEVLAKPFLDSVFEIEIFLGAKAKVASRLIIEWLPSQMVEQRKRRQRQRAKKRGKTPSQLKLALCQYNLIVTNVPCCVFPPSIIRSVYSLYGQIELVFKARRAISVLSSLLASEKPELNANYMGDSSPCSGVCF